MRLQQVTPKNCVKIRQWNGLLGNFCIILTSAIILVMSYLCITNKIYYKTLERLCGSDTKYKPLAIVSGAFGKNNNESLIVHPSYDRFDCFFVTDNCILGERAQRLGWEIIWSYPKYNDNYEAALASKQLKTNTQAYLPSSPHSHQYKFVMWVDSKQRIEADEVVHFLSSSDDFCVAMVPHDHLHCALDEFNASQNQARYRRDKERMQTFMQKQREQGFLPTSTNIHYLTGFIIWNLSHPKLAEMQSLWTDYISEVGIECQLSFYYVAERFRDVIATAKWSHWVKN